METWTTNNWPTITVENYYHNIKKRRVGLYLLDATAGNCHRTNQSNKPNNIRHSNQAIKYNQDNDEVPRLQLYQIQMARQKA